jgi:CDP-6-deoxy-D-xylo-4-hexulose-3-dehydrase
MSEYWWPLMSNNISRIDLNELIRYLEQDDPRLTHGPKVVEFEIAWSQWIGTKHSVMVNSGSSANDLTMLALREFYGTGEVIVPPLTWVSDVASVIHAGMKPIFVDVKMSTLAMQEDLILNAVTPRTKAVFLTHVLGFNGLSNTLLYELERLGIRLIEDVCESHGATHIGRRLGSFGWASNFSFYYAHHLTTIEGGAICTSDTELWEFLRSARSHGLLREVSSKARRESISRKFSDLNPEFIFQFAAHNMRPTEIQGILGLSQLPSLDSNNEKRNRNKLIFLENLNDKVFYKNFETDGMSNYAFVLILNEPDFDLRNKFENNLRRLGIEFRRGLSGGGNQLRQPYLAKIQSNFPLDKFPHVEHIHNFSWYLGNNPGITENSVIELVERINQSVN